MLPRAEIIAVCEREVLEPACRLFGINRAALKLVPGYEGCANLVYEYERAGQPLILRITYNPERTASLIQAELHFVYYLSEQGVRVSVPIKSQGGNLLETTQAAGIPFHMVSFVKGKGMRVPDNRYRYRTDAPIEEYFQNWGRVLGQMHTCSKSYQPSTEYGKRPDWFELHRDSLDLDARVPARLHRVRQRIQATLDEIKSLPKERDSYGLIHGDFNDGNFTVDYNNGDITVFDFDDCCYFWFMYELASAWEGGIGRVMFRGLDERIRFMDHYMEQVMLGYVRENSISAEWLERLPLFIKLVQIEEFLHFVQYIDDPDPELQAELGYKIKCIEDDIPYLGFFDRLYSPEKPFSL